MKLSVLSGAFLCLFVFLPFSALAQSSLDVRYDLDGDYLDQNDASALIPNGPFSTTAGRSGNGIFLEDQSWLAMQDDLKTLIRTDSSLYVSVDFFLDHERETMGSRMLFGNKNFEYCEPGISAFIMNYGGGEAPFLRFNMGASPCREIAGGFADVEVGVWHTFWMHLDFVAKDVTIGLNGQRWSQPFVIDIAGYEYNWTSTMATLSTTPLLFGAPTAYDENGELIWESEWIPYSLNQLPVVFDNITISSPRAAGNTDAVISALQDLTGHLNGNTTLSAETIEVHHRRIQNDIDAVEANRIIPHLRTFVDAYASVREPLYSPGQGWGDVRYTSFDLLARTVIDAGSWLMTKGLTNETVTLAEGLVFEDHEVFPGPVDPAAQRVASETVSVDATFVQDPYYHMMGLGYNSEVPMLSTVFKPTGLYAPAGELVTVQVDPALVGSGVHLRVGVHNFDHRGLPATARFPVLKVDYPIESETMQVMNPFGGGIYLLLPQPVELGPVDLTITGAVRAPFFRWTSDYRMTRAEWQIERQHPAPFADFISDTYHFSVWSDDLRDFSEPDTLMARWDRIMDTFQKIFGRPMERIRQESYVLDATSSAVGSYPAGYPQSPGTWAEWNNDITRGSYSPFGILGDGVWNEDRNDANTFAIMLHEMGHTHGPYTLAGEREAIVDVPGVAVLNVVMGEDLDTSVKLGAGNQRFTRLDAAIDWMAMENFRAGEPIDEQTRGQQRYQARARAKYADLADITGGWDAMGDIYRLFYEEDVAKGVPILEGQIEVPHDKFLTYGSSALGCNLASLWHIWGIHPIGSAAKAELATYQPCPGAQERVEYYLRNAPRNRADIMAYYNRLGAPGTRELENWVWDGLVQSFDQEEGQQIRNVGADILSTYFDVEADQPPAPAVARTGDFALDGSDVTFAWTRSGDPEGDALSYTWSLMDAQSGELLLSRSWLADTSITITGAELNAAIGHLDGQAIMQTVTTSDLFTIVTGSPMTSDVTGTSVIARSTANTPPYLASALATEIRVVTDRTRALDLAAFFADAEGDPLTYTVSSSNPSIASVSLSGAIATLTGHAEGSIQLTVSATDGTFAIQTETVVLVRDNQSPTLASGALDTIRLVLDRTRSLLLSDLVTDPEGDELTFAVSSSNPGVVSVSIANGSVVFTPVAEGSATVTLNANDGFVAGTIPLAVVVTSNSPPEVLAASVPSPYRVASGRLSELDPATFLTDADGHELSLTASSSNTSVVQVSVSRGLLLVQGVDLGMATMTVTASDGFESTTVTFGVETYTNTPPFRDHTAWPESSVYEVILGEQRSFDLNDGFQDPDGDTLQYWGGASGEGIVEMVIDGNMLVLTGLNLGTEVIILTAWDGLAEAPTWSAVRVRTNVAPAQNGTGPDDISLVAGQSMTQSLSGLFTDADGDSITLSAASSDQAVATTILTGESLEVTGLAAGESRIDIVASDGFAESTLSFGVSVSPNAQPQALADAYETKEDEVLEVNAAGGVLSNDTDPDGDVLQALLQETTSFGNLTLNPDGSFRYEPATDFHGQDSFVYVASDGYAQSAPTTVTLTVKPVNDAPSAASILSPTEGAELILTGDSGQMVDVVWRRSIDVDNEPVTYRWRLLNASGSPIHQVVTPDTLLSLAYGDLASILTSTGIETGGSFSGSHEVWARDAVDSTRSVTHSVTIVRGLITSLEGMEGIPDTYRLETNYPNPFSRSTVLRYGVPEPGPVRIVIYDMLGRVVAVPLDEHVTAGWHQSVFDASFLASGMYFQVLEAGNHHVTRSLLLTR